MKRLTAAQEAWLTDLETTDAPQTKYKLQTSDGFCCLGRACIIAEQHGIAVHRFDDFVSGSCLSEQKDVFNWLGLHESAGFPYPDNLRWNNGAYLHQLTALNDQGKSFKEIAAIVRKHPEAYLILEDVPDKK